MALIGEELPSETTLDKVLRICSGRQPEETSTENLAYKIPGCGVVIAKTSMDFGQKLTSFLFGDTSLKYSDSTLLVELSFINLVGFRAPNDASSLILGLRELSPIKVGLEGFGPWGNYYHY